MAKRWTVKAKVYYDDGNIMVYRHVHGYIVMASRTAFGGITVPKFGSLEEMEEVFRRILEAVEEKEAAEVRI